MYLVGVNQILASGIFNPFKPNGISHSYHLDQSISVLIVAGGIIIFLYSSFNKTICKQIHVVETLIRRRVLRRLFWVYAVCPIHVCPIKRIQGLYGLNKM